MRNKYLIIGIISVTAFFLGFFVFSTCNPISNKCSAQVLEEKKLARSLVPIQFKNAISSGGYKLIDIRTVEEYSEGHIQDSENIDYYQTAKFFSYLDSLDKDGKYLIYCRSGNRTAQALNIMEQKGFENVSDLKGGINAWNASGYPVINL